MSVTLFSVLLACGQSCAPEGEDGAVLDLPPLEESEVPGPSDKDPTNGAETRDLTFPLQEGSTEIWSGGRIVGVGFRSVDGMTEHVFMFDEALNGDGTGNDPDHPSFGRYRDKLAPHPSPDLAGGPAAHRVRALHKCNIFLGCGPCDLPGNPCFDSLSEFEDPQTGVWKILQDRAGGTATPGGQAKAVAAISRNVGVGAVADVAPLTQQVCENRIDALGRVPVHVDRVFFNQQAYGWSWVADTSNGGTTSQVQIVVMPELADGLYHESYHVNDALPSDGSSPPDGVVDEWCAARVADCQGKSCEIGTVSFTYP